MATKIYALPDGVAGTEAVGGCTHVDATDVGREGRMYWARVTGGTLELVDDPAWVDPEDGSTAPQVEVFVPKTKPVPFVQTIHITDSEAFETWCGAAVEDGGAGRPLNRNGHVAWTEEDVLVYALNQWLSE